MEVRVHTELELEDFTSNHHTYDITLDCKFLIKINGNIATCTCTIHQLHVRPLFTCCREE